MMQRFLQSRFALCALSACALAVMGLALVPAASAAEALAEEETPAMDAVAPVQHSQAMRVYKDPETGRLVAPPREVREALAAADKQRTDLNQSAEGLQARVHRNGMVTMDLQGRFQSHYVVTRGEHGELEHICTEGELALIEKLISDYQARKAAATQEVPNDR